MGMNAELRYIRKVTHALWRLCTCAQSACGENSKLIIGKNREKREEEELREKTYVYGT